MCTAPEVHGYSPQGWSQGSAQPSAHQPTQEWPLPWGPTICILPFIISRKVEHNWNTTKDLCSVGGRCCDWSNVSEVVCKVSWFYWHFGQIILCCGAVWCIGRCLAAALGSTHWKLQTMQINKVTGENEKCVFYFTEKKLDGLFGQPNISLVLCN